MDYRSQGDHSMGIPTPASSSLAYNNNNPCPIPVRVSAFSKPNSSSSPKDHHTPIRNGSSAHSHDHLGHLPSSDNSAADHHHHLHPPAADPAPLVAVGASASTPKSATSLKYRECLRNHAAAIGGHVLDGCCEFMPGDADPLKCAACDCHRSFHRKQTEGGGLDSYYHHHHHRRDHISVPLLLPPPHPLTHTATQHKQQNPCAFPAAFGGGGGGGNTSGSGATTESSSEERLDHHSGRGPTPPASKKRFRTKFTAEQKEKMMGLAERVGWRIQRQDDATVDEFCRDVGITRQVLRVWMHNNKHHSIKKQETTTTATATAAEH